MRICNKHSEFSFNLFNKKELLTNVNLSQTIIIVNSLYNNLKCLQDYLIGSNHLIITN